MLFQIQRGGTRRSTTSGVVTTTRGRFSIEEPAEHTHATPHRMGAWRNGISPGAIPARENRRRQFAAEKLEMACQRLGPCCAAGNVEDPRYWIITDTLIQYRHHRPTGRMRSAPLSVRESDKVFCSERGSDVVCLSVASSFFTEAFIPILAALRIAGSAKATARQKVAS